MEELIQKLQKGSMAERIAVAVTLGNSGNPQAIYPLKEALNGLTPPRDETYVVPGGWGNYYDANPEQSQVIDPDRDLREAIEDAIKKLEK